MNVKLKILIALLILNLFQNFEINGQNRNLDSLKQLLDKKNNTASDTIICNILLDILDLESSDKLKEEYSKRLLEICVTNLKIKQKPKIEHQFFKRCLAGAYNNLGYIAKLQGNIPLAINNYLTSLKYLEEINSEVELSITMINLGNLYYAMDELDKAIELLSGALKITKSTNDLRTLATVYNSLGGMFSKKGDLEKSLEYYNESLELRKKLGDKRGMGTTIGNIGAYYQQKGDFKKSIEFYKEGLTLDIESGNKKGTSKSYYSIGYLQYLQKNFPAALENCKKSMAIAQELGYPDYIRSTAKMLNLIYKDIGNYKLSLENYELYIQMRDSLNNENTRKSAIKSQLKYEYEKQAAADSVAHAKESEIKNVELEKQKIEIAAKKNQQYALFGGLALVIIFAGFMYNRFKITQKQKFVIEDQKIIVEGQKKIVEEKQKEVLDSIRYAKRIQTALIPSDKYIDKSLNKLQRKI